jgi:poly(3-hydroxybutyrate) depolymerase
MFTRLVSLLIIATGLTINAQTINVHGNVSNKAGKAIPNAILTLALQGLSDTTEADGAFSISNVVGVVRPIAPSIEKIMMSNGVLELTLSYPSPMKVEMFDVGGNLLKKEVMHNAPAGVYRMNVAAHQLAAKLLVIKASIGNRSMTFRYLPLNKGKYTINSSIEGATRFSGGFAKLAAVVDTLKASASGYTSAAVPITSLDTTVNITLDSAGTASGTGSIGCGKTLGSINKSGTYTITSSGKSRTYIIDIPANYDKNKPYRLIFGMHCMGGSAAKVAGTNDQTAYFYHLKTLSTSNNIPCIFVAPQGNSDGTWGGDADHKFFTDMLKLFKDTLCIDTARVFSCGFSFGAMFTYSLSTAYQKELRAVACYAPANYNIYLPTNKHLPIAYYQTTGTSDGTCPWDNGGRGGKYCLQGHIQDNGCTSPSTIPLATSNKHVATEFSGCKEGYPVKFSSFQGGHQCNVTDGGSSTDWVPVETWEFFMRF